MVARAWTDPEYKERLLADGVSAIKELGISAEGWKPHGGVTGEGRLVLCSSQHFTRAGLCVSADNLQQHEWAVAMCAHAAESTPCAAATQFPRGLPRCLLVAL